MEYPSRNQSYSVVVVPKTARYCVYICCLFLSMRRALGLRRACILGLALGYCYKTMLKYSLKRG